MRIVAIGFESVLMYECQAHSCALLSFGAVACWGANIFGEVKTTILKGLGMYQGDGFFFVAAWRRHNDHSKHSCACCWIGQQRCNDCVGGGKFVCRYLRCFFLALSFCTSLVVVFCVVFAPARRLLVGHCCS